MRDGRADATGQVRLKPLQISGEEHRLALIDLAIVLAILKRLLLLLVSISVILPTLVQ